MKHTLPHLVTSPKGYVEIIEIIYDGNDGTHAPNEVDVSVAKIKWEGQLRLAIRWNYSMKEWDDVDKKNNLVYCKGMPTSHGKPVWFVIPEQTFDIDSDFFKEVSKKLKNNTIYP